VIYSAVHTHTRTHSQVVDGLLDDATAYALRAEVKAMHAGGKMTAGEVMTDGHGSSRDDAMCWVDPLGAESAALGAFARTLDPVVMELANRVPELRSVRCVPTVWPLPIIR
jgi:hypothetical protein